MGEHTTSIIELSMACETTSDPAAMHGVGGLNPGIPLIEKIPLEIYTVKENGENVMYTCIMGIYGRKVLPAPEEGAQEKQLQGRSDAAQILHRVGDEVGELDF